MPAARCPGEPRKATLKATHPTLRTIGLCASCCPTCSRCSKGGAVIGSFIVQSRERTRIATLYPSRLHRSKHVITYSIS